MVLALTLSVAILLAAFCFAPEASAAVDGVFETESASGIASPESEVRTDSSYASDGKYVAYLNNDTLSKSVTTTEPTEKILVRGAGRYCKNWAKANIQVDGDSIGTITFDNKGWTDFTFTPTSQIAAGDHTVTVSFVNDYATSKCNRDLLVDKVTLVSAPASTPVSAPAPTPTPPLETAACDKYTATTGSDTGSTGTEAQPYATPEKLVASLADGQTGCLKSGDYGNGETWNITNGGTASARVTLMSDPNGSTRARLYKRVVIPNGTNFVTLRNLKLDGTKNPTYTYGYYAPLHVIGDDANILGSDITNRNAANTQGGICAFFGDPTSGTADRTLIKGNTVHHCGTGTNLHMHGLYINYAHDTQVVGNYLYDITAKAVLLYRDADRSIVRGNVIDRAGTGIHFGSGNNFQTDNAVVRNNVVTNPLRNNEGIMEWWETGVGTGNKAYNNCSWPSGSIKYTTATGFVEYYSNTYADPRYANPTAGDYTVGNATCAALLAEGRK